MLPHQFKAAWEASVSLEDQLILLESVQDPSHHTYALNDAIHEGDRELVMHFHMSEDSLADFGGIWGGHWSDLAQRADTEFITMLLDFGGQPSPGDVASMLYDALQREPEPDREFVQWILDLGFPYSVPGVLFSLAARHGFDRILAQFAVRHQLNIGFYSQQLQEDGCCSDLMVRVCGGPGDYPETIRQMIALDFDPDKPERAPPLVAAAARGHLGMVRVLVEGAEDLSGRIIRANICEKARAIARRGCEKHPGCSDRAEIARILA